MRGEWSAMFTVRGRFVKTRCRGASIPTTAGAEVALLHSRASLQDFRGSVGPSVGTSGSNLSHRHHTVFPYKLPSTTCMHATDTGIHSTSKGNRCYYFWSSPTLIKMWQLTRCPPPLFLCCQPLISLAWSNPAFTWALIREGDAAGERTRESLHYIHPRLKNCRFKVGSRAGRQKEMYRIPESTICFYFICVFQTLGSPVNCIW